VDPNASHFASGSGAGTSTGTNAPAAHNTTATTTTPDTTPDPTPDPDSLSDTIDRVVEDLRKLTGAAFAASAYHHIFLTSTDPEMRKRAREGTRRCVATIRGLVDDHGTAAGAGGGNAVGNGGTGASGGIAAGAAAPPTAVATGETTAQSGPIANTSHATPATSTLAPMPTPAPATNMADTSVASPAAPATVPAMPATPVLTPIALPLGDDTSLDPAPASAMIAIEEEAGEEECDTASEESGL